MKILLVGDIMLGRLVNEVLTDKAPAYPWANTLSIFKSADLRIGNLECALTDAIKPWLKTPKVFHFRSDSKNVNSLLSASIDIVSIANNHILDFNVRGLKDTLTALKQAGIKSAGAGLDITEAKKPVLFKIGGLCIGFIAFTDNEPDWEASENKPGIFYVPVDLEDKRAKELLRVIAAAKRRVDLLIVSAHWGGNWGYEPPCEHTIFAQAMIDAGADVIYGHSAHVLRGVKIYKNRPILYSTGDFVDDYAVDDVERNDESLIFLLEIANGRLNKLSLYPTVIDNFRAKMAGARSRTIASKMSTMNQKFGTETLWVDRRSCLEINLGN